MKKQLKKMASVALMGLILWSPFAAQTSAAEMDPISPQKVMWGANELVKGQIGRLVFLKDVKLYKRDANGPSFHRVAKKGSLWRVYEIKNINGISVYNLGGNVFVSQSNLSAYEKVPSDKIQALGVKIHFVESKIPERYEYDVTYLQFSGIFNKNVEKTLNTLFSNMGNRVKEEQLAVLKLDEQDPVYTHYYRHTMHSDLLYNFNNKLSIRVSEAKDVFGSKGFVQQEYYTFDLITGKRLYLKDILTRKEQIEKVNKYLKETYKGRYGYEVNLNNGDFYFVDEIVQDWDRETAVMISEEHILGIGIRTTEGYGIFIPKEIYN